MILFDEPGHDNTDEITQVVKTVSQKYDYITDRQVCP